jgi:hypothetical protein
MFEQEREPGGVAYALLMFAGLLIGLIGSAIAAVFVYVVVMALFDNIMGKSGMWIGEILDVLLLGGSGYFVLKTMDRSATARGVLIGMSLAFLLNAICGIELLVNR